MNIILAYLSKYMFNIIIFQNLNLYQPTVNYNLIVKIDKNYRLYISENFKYFL